MRRFAAHRPRPQIGDWRRTVRVLGIEVGQFLFRLFLDFHADPPQLICEPRPMARDAIKHYLEDQAGNRVEVAGEGLAAEPQRLERDGATASEWVHDQGRLLQMSSASTSARPVST